MHCAMSELPLIEDYGEGFRSRMVEWGGMIVSYETFLKGTDATPLFKGLPDDLCQSPHWGYVLKGRVRIKRKGWRCRAENRRRLLPRARPCAGLRRRHRGARVQPEEGISDDDRRREQEHRRDASRDVRGREDLMAPQKLRLSQRHSELATELVRRLKQENEALWKRWLELEMEKQGIVQIHNEVMRFLKDNVEVPMHDDYRALMMAMREIANREAKQASSVRR